MLQRVFVDANVLASRTCRDWLFLLREENDGMYQLHVTPDVLAETVRVMRRNNPRLPGGVVTDLLAKVERCVDEVVADFPPDVPFSGADAGDYHVHAAAVASRADLILTFDDPVDITRHPDSEQ